MDRRLRKRYGRWVMLVLGVAILAPAAGCTNFLFTVAYLLKGINAPAEFDKLKDKKVAVVCRQTTMDRSFRHARVEQDLADQVSLLLGKNVPKVKMIPQRKVAEWMDENSWEEYIQVGKALQADMVVGIDLEGFELHQGQTLYQGRATVSVRVYDCKTGEVVFRRKPAPCIYPPNRVVSQTEKQESQFRQEFLGVLSGQIARMFFEHDPYADMALDAKSLD